MPLPDWFDRLGGLTPIHGHLHRSPIPMTSDHFRRLRDAGIEVVFSLEEAVPGAIARAHGHDWRPHFWTDDAPPTYEQMDAFLDSYLKVPDGAPTLVHCKAGWGRAGSAIACALVARHGFTAERALQHFWSRVPPAQAVMTSNGQAEFVRGYAASLKGRGLR
ncbi:MAG TPA: protein-tyrosine phosphatase family protein [Candidatus Thermoplasmatota archaeon]|nr:protein-tyrosine phosphatase family protein [Candidatus Thermoplasmatota archaeon]